MKIQKEFYKLVSNTRHSLSNIKHSNRKTAASPNVRGGVFCLVALLLLLQLGCGQAHRYEDFFNSDKTKNRETFNADAALCEAEKGKFSHMIQGREFGFKGADTGFLGCMKLRGWDKKTPEK